MKMKCILAVAAAGPAAAAPVCEAYAAGRDGRPNIVVILADDLGYGDLSCLNPEGRIMTGSIDALAADGVVFSDAHSSSSVSTPSRYSILTGRYNWRSGMKAGVLNGYSAPLIGEDRATIASVLKRSGYRTACIGKWHLGWNWAKNGPRQVDVDFAKPITGGPASVGFDYFFGISASLDFPPYVYVENDMATMVPDKVHPLVPSDMEYMRQGPVSDDFRPGEVLERLTDEAVRYIGENAGGDRPFFLYFPMTSPHTPILPSDEFRGKSGLNPYGDFVLMTDAMVGRVTEALKGSGVYDDTVIIFISDNGCSPSADYPGLKAKGHNPSGVFRGHKADLYEGGHRVPMIVTWKGEYRHHEVDQTVCYTDLFATLASIAGEKTGPDEGEDSYDITPLLKRPHCSRVIREATVHHSINGSFAIRQGEWKLILSPGSAGWSYPRPGRDDDAMRSMPQVQLYRLSDDISEQYNLCSEYPGKVKELTGLLLEYVMSGRSTPGPVQQNENMENWKQLDDVRQILNEF